LFINCGGREEIVGDKTYEGDREEEGTASYFYNTSDERWGFSNTGYFQGNDSASFITRNFTTLHMSNPTPYYTSARLSPLSLKYYGLCLQKGNYNVTLYFAEIILNDGQNFSSKGRRIFDVSIQVLLDFPLDFIYSLCCSSFTWV
jgi:hypothetical protein